MFSNRSVLMLLAAIAVALALTGFSSQSQPEPTATPDIPATVSAAVSHALGTPVMTPTGALPGYCGRLCDGDDYWRTAELSDVQMELVSGVDVNATGKNGWTPLYFATVYGYTSIVSLLLEHSAAVEVRDESGWPPLFYSIISSYPDIVTLLLDQGADVNAMNYRSVDRLSLVRVALLNDDPASTETLKILLRYGADVNAKTNAGSTPLHWADSPEQIAILLDHGAEITAKDAENNTPLHYATLASNSERVRLLMYEGSEVDARNIHGQTACQKAHQDHQSICLDPVTAFLCPADEEVRMEIRGLLCR